MLLVRMKLDDFKVFDYGNFIPYSVLYSVGVAGAFWEGSETVSYNSHIIPYTVDFTVQFTEEKSLQMKQ